MIWFRPDWGTRTTVPRGVCCSSGTAFPGLRMSGKHVCLGAVEAEQTQEPVMWWQYLLLPIPWTAPWLKLSSPPVLASNPWKHNTNHFQNTGQFDTQRYVRYKQGTIRIAATAAQHASCVLCIVSNDSHARFHFLLFTTLWGSNCHPSFTLETRDTRRVTGLNLYD